MDASRPIGVFDSGVGGLTVVRALMERLPLENIVYFGDTARVPYGVKSVATIEHFTGQIVDYLLGQQVKMLIVACNTMAAVAAHVVKARAGDIPVLDVIEAGAQAAVRDSGLRGIGVIGTPTTVNSNAYARRMHQLDPGVRVYSQACPLFVPLVEEGWLDHPVTRLTAQEYLKPVLAEEVDSLVLGCTHYPLLKPLLKDVVGEGVRLVDSATTTAELAALRLHELGLASRGERPADYRFVVTDVPLRFQTIGERFLGRSLGRVERLEW
ncbi:glutamate racemase [Thauera sp. CAU 1555]|jgi:glutamate racemase|uniref:Glutamate racemase n=1 Tax=Thauera sedimentorum TaxID=2767595 RepID=A0ABR9BER1_9RHOO|nr:glutamate racemase [Thauera sedimentorum]MBC9073934.1 glutamate racemase [Thauera sedimentorum]MBD8504853.1 glutamate racemase [Thauera sedimentorum]